MQCPVKEGQYTVDQTVELPAEIPKGTPQRNRYQLTVAKFVVSVRGYTADDDDMVCLDLIVDFVSHSRTS